MRPVRIDKCAFPAELFRGEGIFIKTLPGQNTRGASFLQRDTVHFEKRGIDLLEYRQRLFLPWKSTKRPPFFRRFYTGLTLPCFLFLQSGRILKAENRKKKEGMQ